jgi:hypothetical protein
MMIQQKSYFVEFLTNSETRYPSQCRICLDLESFLYWVCLTFSSTTEQTHVWWSVGGPLDGEVDSPTANSGGWWYLNKKVKIFFSLNGMRTSRGGPLCKLKIGHRQNLIAVNLVHLSVSSYKSRICESIENFVRNGIHWWNQYVYIYS